MFHVCPSHANTPVQSTPIEGMSPQQSSTLTCHVLCPAAISISRCSSGPTAAGTGPSSAVPGPRSRKLLQISRDGGLARFHLFSGLNSLNHFQSSRPVSSWGGQRTFDRSNFGDGTLWTSGSTLGSSAGPSNSGLAIANAMAGGNSGALALAIATAGGQGQAVAAATSLVSAPTLWRRRLQRRQSKTGDPPQACWPRQWL